jgi:tRNA(Ile)-lysidine synthase
MIAFSGGRDSTALAAAFASQAPEIGPAALLAHIDHRMDEGSAKRRMAAAGLADRLGLPFRCVEVDVPLARGKRESLEVAGRRARYAALEELAAEVRADRILTAHQRDDQIETILLELLRGAPVEALGGIPERRGRWVRPLLGVSRAEIDAFLDERGLIAIDDPTNLDLRIPRNRVRHLLLPRLREVEPGIDEALLALAARSRALGARLDRELGGLEPAPEALGELPPALRAPALRGLLHHRFGLERLPSQRAVGEFLGQLERNPAGARLNLPRVDGAPRALVARGGELAIEAPEPSIGPFSYTFSIPGEVEIVELGLFVRIRRSPVEPWMLRGDPRRAGFTASGLRATVRNRRPGDWLRPLGAPGTRKLKELLIDRRIPAPRRDRLPLVEIGGRLVWVPGVALADEARLDGQPECWLAEIEPASGMQEERKTTT